MLFAGFRGHVAPVPFAKEITMKKFAAAVLLTLITTASFAGGCWQGGKYVQCPKAVETPTSETGA